MTAIEYRDTDIRSSELETGLSSSGESSGSSLLHQQFLFTFFVLCAFHVITFNKEAKKF